jgi:capsular exopolysaccharide synthesis family protein
MFLKSQNQESVKGKRNKATHLFPESLISEQYRSIRTNLQFINGIKRSQSILITSPNNGEGKSTTAVNLAISLTQQKERVLLVDGNISKPSLHNTFNLNNTSGLIDVLNKEVSFETTISKTEIIRLDVLPSGPSLKNSVELIGSETMFELMKELLIKYDYVIIDAPPVLELSDTKILANLCDGVVLVIKSEKTEIKKALEAKRFLELAKANIIGVVLNEKGR